MSDSHDWKFVPMALPATGTPVRLRCSVCGAYRFGDDDSAARMFDGRKDAGSRYRFAGSCQEETVRRVLES